MGPGGTYAVVVFLAGAILLLGWLYATAGNPRSGAILKKSLLIFVLPMLLVPAWYFQGLFGMWAWLACEEGLKAFASTRERKPLDKFWLVVLFGIWELALDKPFWAILVAQSAKSWDRLSLAELAYATALPALMHAVTAAIYAFTPVQRLWAALVVSWIIHASFNAAAEHFYLSPVAIFIETGVLCAILAVAFETARRLQRLDAK